MHVRGKRRRRWRVEWEEESKEEEVGSMCARGGRR